MMESFASYYAMKFRLDINQFFSNIPEQSRFHEDMRNKELLSIQYERLTCDFKHLDFLNKDETEYFGVSLFFTVLTDMVCYTHYKNHYNSFRKLTRYPKFIGNCPGGCHYHYHPRDIFIAMNFSRTKRLDSHSQKLLVFYDKFLEAVPFMEQETKAFFEKQFTEVDGQLFWATCKSEFPYRLTNYESKNI